MSYWAEKAQRERAKGYRPGNHWERQLRKHLTEIFPALVKELGKDFENYLQSITADVMELYQTMLDQGTDPQAARELAMAELLPAEPEKTELVLPVGTAEPETSE